MGDPVVDIYSVGMRTASVCAPKDMPQDKVLAEVNRLTAGTKYPWHISNRPRFHDGEPNPCRCQRDGTMLHWLLTC